MYHKKIFRLCELIGKSLNEAEVSEVQILSFEIKSILAEDYLVDDWKSLNHNLLNALETEKIVMGLILSLIIMVACLNIIGTLILVVLTRNREIAILRAMGATSRQVCGIFMFEGLIIGVVGTILGTILGVAGCWGVDMAGIDLDIKVYYLDKVPVVIDYTTVFFVAVVAILISFLATIYPAIVASKLEPVEGLRYD